MATTVTEPATKPAPDPLLGISEGEARSLIFDVLNNTDFDSPEALLRLLIRLNNPMCEGAIMNSLDALIEAAFTRSEVCGAAREAYVDAVTKGRDPDGVVTRVEAVEEVKTDD